MLFSFTRSEPTDLPSSWSVLVTSRMSSWIWKARPMHRVYSLTAQRCSSVPPAAMQPSSAAAEIRAPVLSCWSCSSSPRVRALPSPAMSRTCPPTMPSGPASRDRQDTASTTRSAGSSAWVKTPKAAVSSPSPARMAVASPYTLWLVGRPRRRSSSSMAGRSSWIRE